MLSAYQKQTFWRIRTRFLLAIVTLIEYPYYYSCEHSGMGKGASNANGD